MQENTTQSIANMMTPKFAISYLRVSSRGQAERGGGDDEGFSIPAQREANKKKALSMGAIVGKEFVDRGASARSAARPELQKMLEYIKENKERVDYVIVHKVDRLARNREDDVEITRILRECGVKLVSTSESIDDTPSGMLLHGIMSSIAEWYSRNLACEVIKGMNTKVQNGGTPTRAPLGYINLRRMDEQGREERFVELDAERAPLIKMAFEEYATGKWTVESLAEHLAALGLTTRATPKIPSNPIGRSALNKILLNTYYKGVVVFKDVEYNGKHTALVDGETWQKVQDVLLSHLNGERTREHPHFLKGSLFCRNCGSRMIITYAKSKSGVRYPYYVCAGRHNKRVKTCKQKAVLIEELERSVQQIYNDVSLDPEIKETVQRSIFNYIEKSQKEFAVVLRGLAEEKKKLEHKRKKLLEAHYNDAIPLELMKSEQAEIGKALSLIEQKLNAYDTEYKDIASNVQKALELIENCGQAYRAADEHIKKIYNQALYSQLWVEQNGKVAADFAEPFKSILNPIQDEIVRNNQAKINGHFSLATAINTIQTQMSHFFGQGLNKKILVEIRRIELLTS